MIKRKMIKHSIRNILLLIALTAGTACAATQVDFNYNTTYDTQDAITHTAGQALTSSTDITGGTWSNDSVSRFYFNPNLLCVDSGNIDQSSIIIGTPFIKSGDGTLTLRDSITLSPDNTGITKIAKGTLKISNDGAIANGSVTISPDATLVSDTDMSQRDYNNMGTITVNLKKSLTAGNISGNGKAEVKGKLAFMQENTVGWVFSGNGNLTAMNNLKFNGKNPDFKGVIALLNNSLDIRGTDATSFGTGNILFGTSAGCNLLFEDVPSGTISLIFTGVEGQLNTLSFKAAPNATLNISQDNSGFYGTASILGGTVCLAQTTATLGNSSNTINVSSGSTLKTLGANITTAEFVLSGTLTLNIQNKISSFSTEKLSCDPNAHIKIEIPPNATEDFFIPFSWKSITGQLPKIDVNDIRFETKYDEKRKGIQVIRIDGLNPPTAVVHTGRIQPIHFLLSGATKKAATDSTGFKIGIQREKSSHVSLLTKNSDYTLERNRDQLSLIVHASYLSTLQEDKYHLIAYDEDIELSRALITVSSAGVPGNSSGGGCNALYPLFGTFFLLPLILSSRVNKNKYL